MEILRLGIRRCQEVQRSRLLEFILAVASDCRFELWISGVGMFFRVSVLLLLSAFVLGCKEFKPLTDESVPDYEVDKRCNRNRPCPNPVPSPSPAPEPEPAPAPAPAPTPTTSPPSGAIILSPGQDLQSAVNSHSEGTQFFLSAGVYRTQSVQPKAGQQFIGQRGINGERLAILNGAALLTQFSREGSYWVATGQTQEGQVHGGCKSDFPRCMYPEDLFFDGRVFLHVASLSSLRSGAYFFDYGSDKIYLLDDPTGHSVEVNTSRVAFGPSAPNVTIRGLIIEKYAIPPQMGAIGDQYAAEGWVIEDNEVRYNHGVGIRVGSRNIVRGNFVHHNGQMGIGGGGEDILVERNEISYNNERGVDPGWEAGATKFAVTTNLRVRCNYVHNNQGPGLWTDIDNIYSLIEKNIVVSNDQMGIFHEISYDAIIRNNIVKWNSVPWYPWLYGAQILSSTSMNVEIYGNVVEVAVEGGNGISVIQQERGDGAFGWHYGKNNYVHHNSVTYRSSSGIGGAASDWEISSFWASGENRFDFNAYHVTNLNDGHWAWNGETNWSNYRSQGQDSNGSADTVITLDQTPLRVPDSCP